MNSMARKIGGRANWTDSLDDVLKIIETKPLVKQQFNAAIETAKQLNVKEFAFLGIKFTVKQARQILGDESV
jgi:hypothetical protein